MSKTVLTAFKRASVLINVAEQFRPGATDIPAPPVGSPLDEYVIYAKSLTSLIPASQFGISDAEEQMKAVKDLVAWIYLMALDYENNTSLLSGVSSVEMCLTIGPSPSLLNTGKTILYAEISAHCDDRDHVDARRWGRAVAVYEFMEARNTSSSMAFHFIEGGGYRSGVRVGIACFGKNKVLSSAVSGARKLFSIRNDPDFLGMKAVPVYATPSSTVGPSGFAAYQGLNLLVATAERLFHHQGIREYYADEALRSHFTNSMSEVKKGDIESIKLDVKILNSSAANSDITQTALFLFGSAERNNVPGAVDRLLATMASVCAIDASESALGVASVNLSQVEDTLERMRKTTPAAAFSSVEAFFAPLIGCVLEACLTRGMSLQAVPHQLQTDAINLSDSKTGVRIVGYMIPSPGLYLATTDVADTLCFPCIVIDATVCAAYASSPQFTLLLRSCVVVIAIRTPLTGMLIDLRVALSAIRSLQKSRVPVYSDVSLLNQLAEAKEDTASSTGSKEKNSQDRSVDQTMQALSTDTSPVVLKLVCIPILAPKAAFLSAKF